MESQANQRMEPLVQSRDTKSPVERRNWFVEKEEDCMSLKNVRR